MQEFAVRARPPASVVTRSAPAVQRCGDHPCPPSGCNKEEEQRLSRSATGPAPRVAPPVVHEVIGSPGEPLPASLNEGMSARFGHDFARVRVHTGPRAAESAASVAARAYTVGQHVVLGRSAPDLHSAAGQRLLAHELTHVIQQPAAVPSGDLPISSPGDAGEREAAAAATRAVPSSAPPSVQRDALQTDGAPSAAAGEAAEQAPAGWQGMLVNAIASGLQLPTLGAVLLGRFGQGIGRELRKEGPGALARLAGHVVSMTPSDVLQLVKGYLIGLPEGIVSPITDLFGLGVFAEQILNVVADMVGGALGMGGKLAAETEAVRNAASRLLANAGQVWERIKGGDLRKLASDLFSGTGSLPAKAGNAAEQLGADAGDAIIAGLDSPWKQEQPEEAKSGGGFHPLAAVQSYVGGKVKQLVGDVPWAKVGEKVGYAIGFALIQVIILVFTDGIGNAIEEGAAALGRFASSLGKLGKAVGTAAEFLGKVGKAVTWVENLVGKVMGAALKPLEHLLKPILEPLTELLGSLRTWLRKLFGVVEKEAPALEKAAAAKAVREADKHVHAPPPPEGTPTPHQPAVQHGPPPEPKPPASDVASPAQPAPKPAVTHPEQPSPPKAAPAPPPVKTYYGGGGGVRKGMKTTPMAEVEVAPASRLGQSARTRPGITLTDAERKMAAEAEQASSRLGKPLQVKTKAAANAGDVARSGYGKRGGGAAPTKHVLDEGHEIGHEFAKNPSLDAGIPGQSAASHAEKLAAVRNPGKALAVDRAICPDCVAFFQKYAQARNVTVVIHEPGRTWVFRPDGVQVGLSPSGLVELRPGGASAEPLPSGRQ